MLKREKNPLDLIAQFGFRRTHEANNAAAEASCFFQPDVKTGAQTGYATMNSLHDAASDLIRYCASLRGEGGMARRLGK